MQPSYPWHIRLLLGVYLLLAVGYGLINPLFEAPDEHHHFFTAIWIVQTGTLPAVPQPAGPAATFVPQTAIEWLGPEAAQPPLYYLLAAVLIAPFDLSQAHQLTIPNLFSQLGDGSAPTNRNAFVHVQEQWPWPPHVWAAHLLRMVSAVIGLVVLLAIYHTALLLWPAVPQRARWATAVVALLPQFTFQFSTISNDVLITALASLALYQVVKIERGDRDTGNASRGQLLLLALTCGAAALTKNQGLLLIGWVFVGLFLTQWGRVAEAQRSRGNQLPITNDQLPITQHLALSTFYFLLPSLALAAPLWWRNWGLYGDFTAANQFVLIAHGDRGFTVWESLAQWPSVWNSLFAVFGWFNILAPRWVQWVWGGVVVTGVTLGMLDMGCWIKQRISSFSLFTSPFLLLTFLAGWAGLVTAALVAFNMQTPAAQGRLLFPTLLPLALLVGYGLSVSRSVGQSVSRSVGQSFSLSVGQSVSRSVGQFWGRFVPFGRLSPLVPHALLALLLTTNLYCLLILIPRTFALPVVGDESLVPATAVRFDTPLGQNLTLLAAEIHAERTQPEGIIPLTLYWRADHTPSTRPELVVELFGRDQQLVGKLQSWHGGGLYPADFWPSGQVVVEQTAVRLPAHPPDLPTLAPVVIRLAGEEPALTIGHVAIEPTHYPPPSPTLLAEWEGVQLVSAEVEQGAEVLEVQLVWQVTADWTADYTLFVHWGAQGQAPVATGDGVPRGGHWPTSHWRAGQQFTDSYTIPLPPNAAAHEHPLALGFYTAAPPYPRLPLRTGGEVYYLPTE